MSRRSIRFRITAVASLLVAIVLAVAGAALVVLQRRALTESIDQTLGQRADDIVALLAESDMPEEFSPGSDEGFVQLVGGDGQVAAATPNLDGAPALDIPWGPDETIRNVADLPVDDDVFRVLSRPIGDGVLHVGTTHDVVSETTAALAGALGITIPAVTVVLGAIVWYLVGRTLRPVEGIRAEVARIESTDLHRRVPQPATGDEIARLAETMNGMLERLESSVARQQHFVADASHELRTPLTRLRTELEVALSSAAADRGAIRSLLDEVILMQTMVEDLLYLARVDAGQASRPSVPVDLDDLVLEESRRVAAAGRVDVDLTGVSGAHVRGDRGQLSRVVRNLLDNAERHASSRVTLELAERDGQAVLRVADDGPGIPEAGVERIFERFGRLDAARGSETGGTGLGLAIAQDIVRRHGGTLMVANAGRPGAVFELSLPTAD